MTDSNHDLPQEWPEHLASQAPISAVRTVAPVGEPLLDFSSMHPTTFEQFCWWLLKKDHAVSGCKRLAGNGTAQEGIDLFAFDEQRPDRLNVFECKAWKNFGATNLTDAVNAFLDGDWVRSTGKYTIILAQRDIGGTSLARRWEKERKRLKEAGIDGDLWTAHNLTLRVQAYPDILSKFFGWAAVETYANQWMQRVAFYELVSKAFFDPRERVARWAREFVSQSSSHNDVAPSAPIAGRETDQPTVDRKPAIAADNAPGAPLVLDGTFRRVDEYGNSWHFKGPWFSLSAILPDQRFTHASAAINFSRPDVEGMTVTVDHKWLLKRFLFAKGAPLSSEHRGFVVGPMPHSADHYAIDLPNCRLSLQEEGAREIAQAADLLSDAMRRALHGLEAAWSATDFPFVMWGSKKVALGAIDVGVWHEIGLFAEAHDVSNGDTRWHMFDGNRNILKPYHDSSNEQFDAGHHGIFYPAHGLDGLSYGREVVLLWQPNTLRPEQSFSSRGWWSCEYAFQWLKEALLPEVKRRVFAREFGSRWRRALRSKRAEAFASRLDELFVVRDLRRPPLIRDGSWTNGIVTTVQTLQRFFHGTGTPEPYVHQRDIERLYETVALIARGKRGHVGYAASKLGLHGSPVDRDGFIDAIHEHIRQRRVVANCSVADNVFRAMLEMLDDSDAWLSESDRAVIGSNITPFALLCDDATLVDRHTRWT